LNDEQRMMVETVRDFARQEIAPRAREMDEAAFLPSEIIDQMKAVCNMIHEVDPRIPIYSSVWHHVPAWDGYLDVWGISHYGLVLPAKIQELLDAGDRVWWTTDGQMCTDTPYAAVERLLPHYCFKYGASAYEFWGIDWLTYDPWKFGWHSYNGQSMSPGETIWVRYPNGDGFLAYPGAPAGFDRPVTSVRMEQAREGCEDYEYLDLLRRLIIKCEQLAVDAGDAPQVMQSAAGLVGIPNAGGRYSTQILPDPDAVLRTKDALGAAIERLSRAFRPPAWPIAGDANNDCRVNVLDLICVRNRINADPAEIDNASADVNGDAKINVLDLIGVRNELGVVCP